LKRLANVVQPGAAIGRLGFEIGSHSMTHAYLSDLSDDALQAEIANSKNELEQNDRSLHRTLLLPWTVGINEWHGSHGKLDIGPLQTSARRKSSGADPFC